MFSEALKVLEVGAGERVDRLPVISHAEDLHARIVVANALEEPHKERRHVLKLIDQDEPDPSQIAGARLAVKGGDAAFDRTGSSFHEAIEILETFVFKLIEVGVESQ